VSFPHLCDTLMCGPMIQINT